MQELDLIDRRERSEETEEVKKIAEALVVLVQCVGRMDMLEEVSFLVASVVTPSKPPGNLSKLFFRS